VSGRLDVVVIGEPLVEISAQRPFTETDQAKVSMSGDALNASVAARLGGARRVALLTRRSDDEFGRLLLQVCEQQGVSTELINVANRPMGVYFTVADPSGSAEFIYRRDDSAASTITTEDVETGSVEHTRALLISGAITATSPGAASAAVHAAKTVSAAGGIVVYDPNYRPRLQTPVAAASVFAAIAPFATLVTPSSPGDSAALFGSEDPTVAAERALSLGAASVVVTMGKDGVLLGRDGELLSFKAPDGTRVVDATGAGDMFAGVVTARLAIEDPIDRAVRLAVAASTISVRHQGGLGGISDFSEIVRESSDIGVAPWAD
jgi:2-dehydro-3-deoxygluconokinase